MHYRD